MTKKIILKKCIEEAVKGGWSVVYWEIAEIKGADDNHVYYDYLEDKNLKENINTILFNHSFLKAFFGEENVCSHCGCNELGIDGDEDTFCKKCMYVTAVSISWKYHGYKLLLSDDRLEYMRKILRGS